MLRMQEWVQSYHYFTPLSDTQKAHFEDQSIIVMCSCREFYNYFRCVHVLVHALAKVGHGIVPRSEDIRIVSTRAGRGRPLENTNRYGVPYIETKEGRRKKAKAN